MDNEDRMKSFWLNGYCADTVQYIGVVGLGPDKKQERLRYMQKHIADCKRCQMANRAKHVESVISQKLTKRGHPNAYMLFMAGQPPPIPYSSDLYQSLLIEALKELGEDNDEFIEFVSQVVIEKKAKEERENNNEIN